jgi:hypothetical protein
VFDGISHEYKAGFIVTGDYTLGYKNAVPLPTHEPLMTLRDPPGGLSYAAYENVHTVMKLEVDEDSAYAGFDASLKIRLGAFVKVGEY